MCTVYGPPVCKSVDFWLLFYYYYLYHMRGGMTMFVFLVVQKYSQQFLSRFREKNMKFKKKIHFSDNVEYLL